MQSHRLETVPASNAVGSVRNVESRAIVAVNRQALEFQIISARQHWRWRLHPMGTAGTSGFGSVPQRAAGSSSGQTAYALLASGNRSDTAHGRNFRIDDTQAVMIDIRVVIGSDQSVRLWYSHAQPGPAPAMPSKQSQSAASGSPAQAPQPSRKTQSTGQKVMALPSTGAPAAATNALEGLKPKTLTREQTLRLQKELIDGYSDPAVQSELVELRRNHIWRMHLREAKEEGERICNVVHAKVLPKYGFPGTMVGVEKAIKMFVEDERFSNDHVVNQNYKTILTSSTPTVPFNKAGEADVDVAADKELGQFVAPLRLVGGFCNWELKVDELLLKSQIRGPVKTDSWSEFSIVFSLQSEDIEFQVVSNKLGFRWRIFPRRADKNVLEKNVDFTDTWLGGEKDGHGANFVIKGRPKTVIRLKLLLRNRHVQTDVKLTYDVLPNSIAAFENTVAIGRDGVKLIKSELVSGTAISGAPEVVDLISSHNDPRRCTFDQIGTLRLIGNFCRWNFLAKGLKFNKVDSEKGWYQYCFCFRLLSNEVDFQIVSDQLHFKWRLFPKSGGIDARVPCKPGKVPAALGGEDDGHGKNFHLRAKPLTVVTLWVQIQDLRPSGAEPAIGQIYVSYDHEARNLTTGISAKTVQFPVRPINALSPEVLQFCTTPEELQDALQKKQAMVRRAVWELQKEYAADDVCAEVASLRELYPHRSRKFLLAIEQGDQQSKQAALQNTPANAQAGKSPDPSEHASTGQAAAHRAASEIADFTAPSSFAPPGTKSDSSATPSNASVATTGVGDGSGDSASSADTSAGGDASSMAATSVTAAEDDGTAQEDDADLQTLSSAGLENLQQQIQLYNGEGHGMNENAAKAHARHLMIQEKILQRYLSRQEVSDETIQSFGDVDAQYLSALQHLPSVRNARYRAMKTLDLPLDMALKVISLGEEYHETDFEIFSANCMTLKRLRVGASPHPDLMKKVAAALQNKGFYTGTPQEWYFALDTNVHPEWLYPRKAAEVCWNQGRFKGWFGGPKAGRYMVTSIDELFAQKTHKLLTMVLDLQDELQRLIDEMGDEGKDLRVERRVLVSFHGQGDFLPPWQDAAGMKSRRLTLTFHMSHNHVKVSDGGGLRLHRLSTDKDRGGFVGEVPGGGGYWTVFYTHKFKQEISKVKLPCGRWCIHVCAEDSKVADKLRGGPSTELAALDEIPDNFEEKTLCDRCSFSAGDGIRLSCKEKHHVCRECIQAEIRKYPVPTCPVCAEQNDRVYISAAYDLFESRSLDDLGCVCPEATIDPGTRGILFGQSKSSNLNGKLCECVWWDETRRCWEVRVFATCQLVSVNETTMGSVDCCPAGSDLRNCPCWPGGRGVYPVSLGCRCASKLAIDECTGPVGGSTGYPYFHGLEYQPFDSILTMLDAILYFLRHNFANFFHFNNKVDVRPDQCPHVVFENWRSTMHSFPHHHPKLDAGKLFRRIERFRVLCRHSRDVRGARPLLFIRYLWNSDEFARVDELYSLLRLWAGPHVRLVCIAMEQIEMKGGPVLLRHERFPRVLFYLVGPVGVMDFMPIREALRFSVLDESGLLHCHSTSVPELLKRVKPFRDPYTQDWLNPLDGKDPAFFLDCPVAQDPGQGNKNNVELIRAVRAGRVQEVQELLTPTWQCVTEPGADANTWDSRGWTPLHHLTDYLHNVKNSAKVKIAASLLLVHGDPRCHDKKGRTVVKAAVSDRVSPELRALLYAGAAEEHVDSQALCRALEIAGEPARSRLARIFCLGFIRAVGDAEMLWRHPPPGSDQIIAEVEEEVQKLELLPEAQRKKALKRLLLEWHPDKNSDRLDLATTVFQYLQTRKSAVIKR